MTNILIMGAGYVGLAHAALFSRNPEYQVTIADSQSRKVEAINKGESPLIEKDLAAVFASQPSNLFACLAEEVDYRQYEVIVLCLPTNYNENTQQFNTSTLDYVLTEIVSVVYETPIIVKSTLPIGYTKGMIEKLNYPYLMFSPEFLREGQALQDNLHPSRLIIGTVLEDAPLVRQLYLSVIEHKEVPVLVMPPSEAESVKLFSNTYLAMRVAFFNELDTFSEVHDLDSRQIIEGVGLDPRIGRFYNNPSFGYGGYCLPKDSKQLRSNFIGLPADLIGAIVTSNDSRKRHIAEQVLAKPGKTVGIYRLTMKKDSDNSRESAVLDIMAKLKAAGRSIIVYEPNLQTNFLDDSYQIETNFDIFSQKSDIILANRLDPILNALDQKVYSRDHFNID